MYFFCVCSLNIYCCCFISAAVAAAASVVGFLVVHNYSCLFIFFKGLARAYIIIYSFIYEG